VGVVTGVLPPEAVEIALQSPYLIYSPLAPAEGLYLRRIVFGRRKSNAVVLMDEENERTCIRPIHSFMYALMHNRWGIAFVLA
jgi:tRNA U38,U39,U40 pseudouridine synthase TruA